jgi:solute carrier family 39 (zinc transporter), member 1/2/3
LLCSGSIISKLSISRIATQYLSLVAHHHLANKATSLDPSSVDLDTADPRDIICYLNAGGNDYNGHRGARISALFVILATSSLTTLFPVVAARNRWLKIPLYAFLFARYFGAGVIIATAFIHLLDPAYAEIGPATCVGMTGSWAEYSWVPAIAMTSAMGVFLLEFAAEWFVEKRYSMTHGEDAVERAVTTAGSEETKVQSRRPSHQVLHSGDQDENIDMITTAVVVQYVEGDSSVSSNISTEKAFREQIAAFLILEFGVLFHSVIIGLNLGVVGDEFSVLYPVVVFHQAFEGLGIGARLCVIPFPKKLSAMPYILCVAYGLTTPIAVAIGIGLSTTYDSGNFTANVVSGVLDSVSAGILLYTGFVELLARDFLFNPERTRDGKRVLFMLGCLFLGIILMSLLGKWA